ncbi:MAG: J domain-containing protein [Bacteroidota bacterium]|jgi:hypothetical protein|nr:J domain-containing protein [Bacteroidota bacterium]
MSYSQILRRLNRIIQSTVNDALDNLSRANKDELDDFDRELRGESRSAGGATTGGQRAGQGQSGYGQAGQHRSGSGHGASGSGQRSSGGGQEAGQSSSKEGRRKPGEKDDAFYYSILGLTPSASEVDIRKAYRRLMSQYHPDRVATLGEDLQRAAAEKAKTINEAYQIIERRRGMK